MDKEYNLTRQERTTLRAAIVSVPARSELADLRPEPGELAQLVLSVLDACHRYNKALKVPPRETG